MISRQSPALEGLSLAFSVDNRNHNPARTIVSEAFWDCSRVPKTDCLSQHTPDKNPYIATTKTRTEHYGILRVGEGARTTLILAVFVIPLAGGIEI